MELGYLNLDEIAILKFIQVLLPPQLHPLDKLLDRIHNIYTLSCLYHILLCDEIHLLFLLPR